MEVRVLSGPQLKRRMAIDCLFLQFRRRRFFYGDPLGRPDGYKKSARTTDRVGIERVGLDTC